MVKQYQLRIVKGQSRLSLYEPIRTPLFLSIKLFHQEVVTFNFIVGASDNITPSFAPPSIFIYTISSFFIFLI